MFVLKQDYFNSKVLEFPKFHSSTQTCHTQNSIQSALLFRSNRSSNRLVSSFVTTTTNHMFGRTNRINNNPSASTAL